MVALCRGSRRVGARSASADALLAYLHKPDTDFPFYDLPMPLDHYRTAAATAMGWLSENKPDLARRMLIDVLQQYASQPDIQHRAQIAVAEIIVGVHHRTQK